MKVFDKSSASVTGYSLSAHDIGRHPARGIGFDPKTDSGSLYLGNRAEQGMHKKVPFQALFARLMNLYPMIFSARMASIPQRRLRAVACKPGPGSRYRVTT